MFYFLHIKCNASLCTSALSWMQHCHTQRSRSVLIFLQNDFMNNASPPSAKTVLCWSKTQNRLIRFWGVPCWVAVVIISDSLCLMYALALPSGNNDIEICWSTDAHYFKSWFDPTQTCMNASIYRILQLFWSLNGLSDWVTPITRASLAACWLM